MVRMESKEQFMARFQNGWQSVNDMPVPDEWSTWLYHAYRLGIMQGQREMDRFLATHDWYE